MSDENNNGRPPAPGGRQPLTLKPRGAGSVSAGTVKQSFSHGRSKTVVVETKRARTHVPGGGNLAAPSSAEKRLFEPRPAPSPSAPRPASAPGDGLSAEERAARQRAIELAQERQAAERTAAEARASAAAAAVVAAAPAPAPAPAPQAPGLRSSGPSASSCRSRRASSPCACSRASRTCAGRRSAARRCSASATSSAPTGGNQTRTYQPSSDRRVDRARTRTYRPAPPSARFEGASFNQGRRDLDDDRRPVRDERGPPRTQDRDDRGPRPSSGGDTVRYSALAPRPAGPRPGGPGARGPRRSAHGSWPRLRDTRNPTARPVRPRGRAARPWIDVRMTTMADARAFRDQRPSGRAKGAPQRREGRLTIQAVAGDDEERC